MITKVRIAKDCGSYSGHRMAPWTGMNKDLVFEALNVGLIPLRSGLSRGALVEWKGYTWWKQYSEEEWNELRPTQCNRVSFFKWISRLWNGNTKL
jgi:hypothetical protein